MSLPNLDNYLAYPPSPHDFLDGRYFGKVLENYPGLIEAPIIISLVQVDNDLYTHVTMEKCPINTDSVGLLRVIIDTPTTRHSNLLIINYPTRVASLFDPINHSQYASVAKLIEKYLRIYDKNFVVHQLPQKDYVDYPVPGFCNAYVIKYAYDYLLDREFDPSQITRFAHCIECTYGLLPGIPDKEYGWPPVAGGAALGFLGGAAIGGLVAGPAGLVVGGLLGGTIGGLAGGIAYHQ